VLCGRLFMPFEDAEDGLAGGVCILGHGIRVTRFK
jgi:hypothetical protein